MPTRTDLNTSQQVITELEMRKNQMATLGSGSLQQLGILNPAEGWFGAWELLNQALNDEIWSEPFTSQSPVQEWVRVSLVELMISSGAKDSPRDLAVVIVHLAAIRLFFRRASIVAGSRD